MPSPPTSRRAHPVSTGYRFGGSVGTVKEVSAVTRAGIGVLVLVVAVGSDWSPSMIVGRRRVEISPDLNESAAPMPSAHQTPSSVPTSATPRAPALLLPNMRSLKPSDLQIEVVGGDRRLRFAASLANVGPGPLLVLPRGRSDCPRGQHPPRRYCIGTRTRTACSSGHVTRLTAAATSAACSATPATGTGTTTQWPPTHYGDPVPTPPWSHATRSASVYGTTVGCACPGSPPSRGTSADARGMVSKGSRLVGSTCTRPTSTGNGSGSPEESTMRCLVWS